jgi:hypothetical protein
MTANPFHVPLWKSMTTPQIMTICLTTAYAQRNVCIHLVLQCDKKDKEPTIARLPSRLTIRPGLAFQRCGEAKNRELSLKMGSMPGELNAEFCITCASNCRLIQIKQCYTAYRCTQSGYTLGTKAIK